MNGYTPTNLRSLSQAPTGIYEVDLKSSRHQRFYKDTVSIKAAQNPKDILAQAYMRDDGTQNIDVSIPLYIKDRHWGCLRMGYTSNSKEG